MAATADETYCPVAHKMTRKLYAIAREQTDSEREWLLRVIADCLDQSNREAQRDRLASKP